MMIERKPVSLRQEFAEAVVAHVPKGEVMRTLGIADSTYYKWKGQLRQHGDTWINGEPITRAICFAGKTVKSTYEQIMEFCLKHPAIGPKQLRWEIAGTDMGQMISASTLHKILRSYGLGTRNQRAAELYKRFLKGMSLTRLQVEFVERVYPIVRWKSAKGRRAGEILTQDTVKLHHASPVGVAAISIVVDTFNSAAFAKFPSRGEIRCLEVECASEVIEEHIRMGRIVRTMYTDMGHEFGRKHPGHVYGKLLAKCKIRHRLIDQQGTKRNPFVQVVWADLREFLFGGGVSNPASYRGRLHELNPMIREFLDKKYGHQTVT